MKEFLVVLSIFILASGCGSLHTPMSEMVMFHEKEAQKESSYSARYSHGLISYSVDRYNLSELNNQARQQRSLPGDSTYNADVETNISTHPIFMFEDMDAIAFSLALGATNGVDATFKLPYDFYLTGAFSPGSEKDGPNTQLILQRRILDGNPTGFSLGITYKKQRVLVPFESNEESECTTVFCGLIVAVSKLDDYEPIVTRSLGIRSMLMLSSINSYGTTRGALYMTGSMNYDFTTNTTYPKVGFSFAIY